VALDVVAPACLPPGKLKITATDVLVGAAGIVGTQGTVDGDCSFANCYKQTN